MKLTLPLAPNKANARHHWRVALKAKIEHWQACDRARYVGWCPQPPERPPSRARLSATLFVWSFMDDDNAMARLKPTLDWLVSWGYLPGDSRKHVEWMGFTRTANRQTKPAGGTGNRGDSRMKKPPFRKVLNYNLPLNATMMAWVQVPSDLTQEEADKLCAQIQTLAVPEQPNVESA